MLSPGAGIPRSEKGAPNGVAKLDATGKVVASELPVIGTPLDEWNATTNAPTLADGVGTAGDLYVVNVAGTQNLGSGSNTYAVGDFVNYTGTKWIKIARDVASTGANPSATVGLTAKNGVAQTFMRSDGAPAIDQAITPTWTAPHAFSFPSTQATPTVRIDGTNPQLEIQNPGAPADGKRWQLEMGSSSPNLVLRTVNDSGSAGVPVVTFTRAANVPGGAIWGYPQTTATGIDGNKLWLAKYISGTGHTDAPKTLGATSTYLQVGGREYGSLGFAGIGFGYVSAAADHPCVWVGHEEKQTAGNTAGDFVVATRATTTNVAPTERLRITAAGDIVTPSAYTPSTDESLATKKYVDDQTTAGVYNVNVTAGTNMQSATTSSQWIYTQVGNVVTVSGTLDATATNIADMGAVTASLPVPTTFTHPDQLIGTGLAVDTAGFNMLEISGNGSNASFAVGAGSAGVKSYRFSFTYTVQ